MEGRTTFSVASDAYAANRPQYPAELFAWIASQCASHERAWDCATGNGQAALALAHDFGHVDATDLSVQQIGCGFPAPNISYSVKAAEETNFPAATFDLVVVAQALHWFDFDRFWQEVRRTARPSAFFCAWGYSWFECDAELQALLFLPILEVLGPHWPSENGILWRGYQSEEIRFPFSRVEPAPFAIELNWDVESCVRHIRTWSAYKRAVPHPDVAQRIARIENGAVAHFRSAGAFSLRAPLSIAAGWVS